MDFQKTMINLHLKANPNEMLVGWYATGKDVNQNSVYIQNWYQEVQRSTTIHLTVSRKKTLLPLLNFINNHT
jgi:translation initiation factor 3 subunit F